MNVNQIILKEIPQGEFETVSIEQEACEDRFLQLVNERKPIRYSVFEMPVIPPNVEGEIEKGGYVLGRLESDQDECFLIPRRASPALRKFVRLPDTAAV